MTYLLIIQNLSYHSTLNVLEKCRNVEQTFFRRFQCLLWMRILCKIERFINKSFCFFFGENYMNSFIRIWIEVKLSYLYFIILWFCCRFLEFKIENWHHVDRIYRVLLEKAKLIFGSNESVILKFPLILS